LYKLQVNDRIYLRSRDFWLPSLIIMLGWSLSFYGWRALVEERNDHLVEAMNDVSVATEKALVERLASQMEAISALSQMWTKFGLRPLPEWEADANLLLQARTGLKAIAWVDLDDGLHRIAVEDGIDTEIDEDDARNYYPESVFVGPERDPNGAAVYRIILPVRTGLNRDGVLVARVQFEDFLAPLFDANVSGYAIRFYWNDQVVFARDDGAADPGLDWWRTERRVALPMGGEWRIVYRPTESLVRKRLSSVPSYLLAAALLVSVLLAAVVHQWRVVSRQARFLSAANRALEERSQGLEGLNQELERRVTDRTELLREAVAELEAFNYSVSHDLRSPLGAVINFAAILEEDYRDQPLGTEGIEMLRRIAGAAMRATNLLEGMLELSHVRRTPLEFGSVDMHKLASEIFAQSIAAEGTSDVDFDLDSLPPVDGDRTLLGALWMNLFTNALKYSRSCTDRRIRVTGSVQGGECVYTVEDNGQGFDMQFESKLFVLFERLHVDEEVEGTGLGLALLARIVERHGGRVWADGELGKGARFSFALPSQKPTET
jgi:signal transduction histidine kinase